jgi:putative ABC transport system permease protein
MASIARKNLFEDIPRFLVAQAGIVFAVSLVTIQTGILEGFTRSTVQLIENSNADIWVAAEEMVHFELTQPLTLGQVAQAQQLAGVDRAEALMIQSGRWRSTTGEIAPVRLIGYAPNGQLFRLWDVTQGDQQDLSEPDTIMLDETNLRSLQITPENDRGSINSIPARVVGQTRGTQSIATSAFVFTSLENTMKYVSAGLTSNVRCDVQPDGALECSTVYERAEAAASPANTDLQPLTSTDPISYVLVRAEDGQNIEALKQQLEGELPGTQAYTQSEMAAHSRSYWQRRTGIGFVLRLGAGVGVVVGMVVVGQILYSSVSDHLKEFGTLKAMGASDRVIYSIIIEQALWMAILGYFPSMAFCLGLGAWTFATQGITILITPISAVGILGLTIVMCGSSALFAIQKVTHVDPAIVFKA